MSAPTPETWQSPPGPPLRLLKSGVALLVLFSTLSVLLVSTGTAASAATETWDPPLVANVSDSYGAGNGSRVYYETECFTSPENFARIVTRQIGGRFGFDGSCGGATSKELREGSKKSKGLTDPWLDANGDYVDLVFTSMGGNDASFSTIATQCIVLKDAAASVDGSLSPCRRALAEANRMMEQGKVIGSVNETLDVIREKMPNATVVLVGYPNLVQGYNAIRDVLDGYTAQQAAAIATRNETEPGKWVFVDRRDLFAGHEVGTGDPWLWSEWDLVTNSHLEVPDDLYHPKPIGWQATAGLIASRPEISKMSFLDKAKGAVVRVADGYESWLVDDQGVRHPLLDGGAYLCAYESNGQRLLIADRAELNTHLPVIGDPASPECDQPGIGDIVVDATNRSWLLTEIRVGIASYKVVKQEVGSSAAFRCLVNKGAEVQRNARPEFLDQFSASFKRWCLDPNEVDGKILVDPDTNASYLMSVKDGLAVRHEIPDLETFSCLERIHGSALRTYVHDDIVNATVSMGDDTPRCLDWQSYNGKILEADGRQVLVTDKGQRGIRDGGSSRCFTEWKGTEVVNVDKVLLDSVPADPAGWAL